MRVLGTKRYIKLNEVDESKFQMNKIDKTKLIEGVDYRFGDILKFSGSGNLITINDDYTICEESVSGDIYIEPQCAMKSIELKGASVWVCSKTKANAGGGASTGGASSWNELKDKPFGEEIVVYNKIFGDTVLCNNVVRDGHGYTNVTIPTFTYSYPFDESPLKIVFDGEEYECMNRSHMGAGNGCYGNFEFLNEKDELYGDLPFLVTYSRGTPQIWAEPNNQHTIEIYEMTKGVTTIDPKYLYDAIIDAGDQESNFYMGGLDWTNAKYALGNYEAIRKKLDNGIMPKIMVRFDYVYGDLVYPYRFDINYCKSEDTNSIEISSPIIDGLELYIFKGTLNGDGSFLNFVAQKVNA